MNNLAENLIMTLPLTIPLTQIFPFPPLPLSPTEEQSRRVQLDTIKDKLKQIVLHIQQKGRSAIFFGDLFNRVITHDNFLFIMWEIHRCGICSVFDSIRYYSHSPKVIENNFYCIIRSIVAMQSDYPASLCLSEISFINYISRFPRKAYWATDLIGHARFENRRCPFRYQNDHRASGTSHRVPNTGDETIGDETIGDQTNGEVSVDDHSEYRLFYLNDSFISQNDDEDYDDDDMEPVVVTARTSEYNDKIEIQSECVGGECCICLEDLVVSPVGFTLDDMVVNISCCGKSFHDKCLRRQLCEVGPPKCPLCRKDVRD
jgi:hypothetical protein